MYLKKASNQHFVKGDGSRPAVFRLEGKGRDIFAEVTGMYVRYHIVTYGVGVKGNRRLNYGRITKASAEGIEFDKISKKAFDEGTKGGMPKELVD